MLIGLILELAIAENNTDIIEVLKQAQEGKRSIQRRRRHDHGCHYHNRHYDHLSRKSLAIDLSNQPEIATSSASKSLCG